MTEKKSTTFNFEKSLTQLNTLVEKMEQGNLPLEKSLKHFEEGIELIRNCQQALQQAEQKVEILVKNNPQAPLEPYQTDE